MEGNGRALGVKVLWLAGCLIIPAFFYFSNVYADTIQLKNGKSLKGLVVESYADRILLSTEKGEIPILLSGIKEIVYSDPEQNFMQLGKGYEAANKFGEALAYYEKASEINPAFEEARTAAMAVRNRFWAMSTEGPRNEIEKQQTIYDAWKKGKSYQTLAAERTAQDLRQIREGMGLVLEKKGDWVRVEQIMPKKDAALARLKKDDRLVAVDGQSLRYLGVGPVVQKLMLPRYSSFMLAYERDLFVHRQKSRDRDAGLRLTLKYEGVAVESVKPNSDAAEAGFGEGDLIVRVGGESTRYTPMPQVLRAISDAKSDPVVCTVRREVLLTRR